ncbi:hypothetical protein [Chryseobacterium jejuense]|uniref:Lipocalin-like domain-containing protein n=1 Tax=Chryseobacterium jejuense TaxID=445960 RepID=A0A2X2X3N3_CHRJE|nr:hypothetical protein [Chryseobacterium jejuense]SDI31596.1 hypothetical protein SAMN05421542_0812 [Chryseobacterium jejuense]SQB44763.1 Uncharacterised protein [Chryseobacterium jejuense]
MMKKLCLILLFPLTGIFNAQTHKVPQSTKDAFKGYWMYKAQYFTNSVVIDFEPGKDFATFKDIGTGEAPPRTLQALVKGNLLIIPAKQHQNDYIELEVIKGKLHLRVKQVTWDNQGNIINNNKLEEKTVFKRRTQRD